MKDKITIILSDLYIIDPSLRQYETKLIKIINKLLESRPDTKFDTKFVKKLRAELLTNAVKLKKEISPINTPFWPILNLNFMKKYSFAAFSLIIVALLATSTYFYFGRSKNIDLAFGNLKIEESSQAAFGSLASSEDQIAATGDTTFKGSNAAAIGRGGGGGGGAPSERGMPTPNFLTYSYTYIGDEFSVSQEKMSVYKKIKQLVGDKSISSFLNKFKLDLLDLNNFSSLNLSNLNLLEDKEFGYGIYINLDEGLVSVNQNWNKWPRPETQCSQIRNPEENQKCFEDNRIKIEDMSADEELIAIAQKFLTDRGISLDNYGQPTVQDVWRKSYELSEDKANYYIPESLPIIFPLVVNGQTVFDQSGFPAGLNVEINIRYKKVAGIYALSALKYASSDYEVETDSQEIINLAERGGIFNYGGYPGEEKEVEINLGTPILSLMMYYKYDYATGQNVELLVPAYLFPILNQPADYYFYKKYVVVPIEKTIFNEWKNNLGGENIPQPEPLIKENVSDIESGSADTNN